MEKHIIAVDHGTSGVKCALMTCQGKLIGHASVKTPLILLPGGGAEQDPTVWWNSFLAAAKDLLDQRLVPAESIAGICVSGQWSTTVAVDKDGNHLMNALSWLDTRGAPYIKDVVRGIINVEGYGLGKIIKFARIVAGGPGLAGKDPVSHMLFIKHEHPDLYEKTDKFFECVDFMNFKLTGQAKATFNSAQLSWCMDNRRLKSIRYYPPLIKTFGIDRDKLPPLIASTDIAGEVLPGVAREIGLPPGVKVFGGAGDLAVAAIGSGATRDYEAHVYLGTSSFLICHLPFKKLNLSSKIASIPSANPAKYFMTIEQENAGNVLTFLRDNMLRPNLDKPPVLEYRDLDVLAAKAPPGSGKLVFTPWLWGERAPVEDPHIRGGLFNLSLQHTSSHVVRAALEGVAYNTRWALGHAERFTKGHKLDPINIIGGGATSDIWCQIYADVLGCTMRRVKDPQWSNARGAAFIAAVGLGQITFEQIPDLIEIERIFTPNRDNRPIYDELFAEFVQIYRNTKKICKRLNQRQTTGGE
nr:FGGY-family carbohydrate kinase [Candidatus Sigynarchaeota archaeon]